LMARNVPLKTEFDEMLRYFRYRLDSEGVDLRLGTTVSAAELIEARFDEVVIATGVQPHIPDIAGIDHPKVLSYPDVLLHRKPVGRRVAIIGTGGIGFDMAEYLLDGAPHVPPAIDAFVKEYGVDPLIQTRGGVVAR